MIIGLDLDNVSGKYTNGLRHYLGDALGIPEIDREKVFPEPADYNFSNWPGVSEDFVKFHSEAVAKGLYQEMDVVPKASETLWRLDSEGHHIRVITSRFVRHGQNAKVMHSTGIWLDKHDIPYRDIMFVRNKMDVFADIYIDDSPENILAFQKAGRPVIIFEAPYNKNMKGLRAKNWDEVYEIISDFSRYHTK